MTAMPKLVLLAAVVACLLLVLASPTSHAAAQSPETDWRINNFDANYVISADGIVHVTEEIDADFGAGATHHGINREIDYRFPCHPETATPAPDNDSSEFVCLDNHSRVYRIKNIS